MRRNVSSNALAWGLAGARNKPGNADMGVWECLEISTKGHYIWGPKHLQALPLASITETDDARRVGGPHRQATVREPEAAAERVVMGPCPTRCRRHAAPAPKWSAITDGCLLPAVVPSACRSVRSPVTSAIDTRRRDQSLGKVPGPSWLHGAKR